MLGLPTFLAAVAVFGVAGLLLAGFLTERVEQRFGKKWSERVFWMVLPIIAAGVLWLAAELASDVRPASGDAEVEQTYPW